MKADTSIASRPLWSVITPELSKYYKEDYFIQPYDDDSVMKDIAKFFYDKEARSITESYRSKLDDFVTRTGAKGPGRSYVNIMGMYCFGDVRPKDDLFANAQRADMQDLYARALAIGTTRTLRKLEFKVRDDSKYDSEDEAMVAINLESLESRGPFDNGTDTLAFKVEEDNLRDAIITSDISDETLTLFLAGLELRRRFYSQSSRINKSAAFEPWTYAKFNEANGTYDTFRGGINAAGDSIINFGQVKYVKWLHYHLPDLDIHKVHNPEEMRDKLTTRERIILPTSEQAAKSELLRAHKEQMILKYVKNPPDEQITCHNPLSFEADGYIEITRLMTIDELVSSVMYDVFHEKKITVWDYIGQNRRFNLVNNLVRDQGSPYKYRVVEVNGHSKLEVYDRKVRKYRQVEPVNCFIQALLIAAGHEIIETAVTLEGRAGMQEPEVNLAKISKFSKEGFDNGLFAINVDLTRFDASWCSRIAVPVGLMYSSLYDDPNMKAVLSLLGYFAMDKFMILAKPFEGADPVWSKYKHISLPAIKSSRGQAILRAARYTKNSVIKRQAEAQLERSSKTDYEAVLVHITDSWVDSGIYFTNTMESDGNQAVHTHVLPHWLLQQPEIINCKPVYRAIKDAYDKLAMKCLTSGDDVTWLIPLVIVKYLGLETFLQLLARGYASIGWTLNWKKMSKVTYAIEFEGETLYINPIEFLQWIYFQNPNKDALVGRRKFNRVLPALPYLERNSNLPLLQQYSNIDGRLNASLTTNEFDLKFAASVLVETGVAYKKLLNQRKLRIWRSKGVKEYVASGDVHSYDPSCEASESELLGLKNYFGYVKKYGNAFMSELSRLSATAGYKAVRKQLSTLAKELETRAPHKKHMVNSILEAFSEDEISFFFPEFEKKIDRKVQSIDEAFLKAIENQGVIIEPLSLPDNAINGGEDAGFTDDSAE